MRRQPQSTMGPRPSRLMAILGLAGALSAVALTAPDAAAEEKVKTPASLPQRTATVAEEKKKVVLSVAYKDAVDDTISTKLMSGLPTVIALRAYLFKDGTTDPIALAARSCRVVYDLWEEVFRLSITEAGSTKSAVAVNKDGVLRQCAEAKKLALLDRTSMNDETKYFVAGIVEVNPVSSEMLERIKKWVTRPNGSTSLSASDSLFGSFVGLFVNRVDSADKRITFRTQTFAPPAPAAAETATAASTAK